MLTVMAWHRANSTRIYNEAVSKISDGAAASVERSVLGWCKSNPNATVAETREAAKLIMDGYVQDYDNLASSFAATWYDFQAEANGVKLQQAITSAVYVPKKTDSVARYQAKKLTEEGPAAFAKACGEYARNDALRALNETIIANVGRDKKKGIRFARVPTGRETCTFRIMLASRGAVYHTRQTAGEFNHFHRRCDCKVVPGFEDDPDAELVEGYKPKELYKLWQECKGIDSDQSLDADHKTAFKWRAFNLNSAKNRPSFNFRAENLDLTRLAVGELKTMQKHHPLEWEGYAQLARQGHDISLLHEQGNGTSNIDMAILNSSGLGYWDLKTIEGGLSALKKRMDDCYSKWERLTSNGAIIPRDIDISKLGNPKVVVDNRYSRLTDDEAKGQIISSMRYFSNKGQFEFEQAILILKDGSTDTFGK